MTIYKLEIFIDGFGGHLQDRFFADYNKAKEALANSTSGIYFSEEDSKWDVEGMKRCDITEENDSFSLIGIQYPKEEWDEFCLRFCRASIIPITLDFVPVNNELYLLKLHRGYRHYFNNANNYNSFSDYDLANQPTTIGYYRSNKKARKIAARDKTLKKIGRIWVTPEFEKECSTLGDGRDYLSINRVVFE